jgi:periplasmic mercuric ion binding protein
MKKILFSLLLSFSLPAAADVIKLQVDGLVCAFCGAAVEQKLRGNTATEDVLVSLEHKLVAVSLKSGQDISDDTLKAQVNDAGYEVKSIQRSKETMAELRAALKAKAK